MMSDLTSMPDTTQHWKAQIHRLAYKNGSITIKDAKKLVSKIEGCPMFNVATFIRGRQWFRQSSRGVYTPLKIWHDSRLNMTHARRNRKDDVEYTIVSLLQNAGSLTTPAIKQSLRLNSSRVLAPSIITTCCNLSTHIIGSKSSGWRAKLK